MTQNRTHTCSELRLEHVGQKVKLSGWMENVREVGQNFAFVILRDFYGTTQVVIETEEMMNAIHGLNKETVIAVEGAVRERSSKNANLPTGEIEVVPEKIEVLGKCRYNELPFQVNRSRDADETLRLKYRYLDLRNPEVKKNIILRCNVVSAIRAAMTDHGFLEITTPILTASSPEGARDYLVPARKHPGKFYALPQAPQQFKQLLMASGFDRYFQIAPCFRDEGCHVIQPVLGKNGREHILDYPEHVVLGGEAHFHVQLVEFARRTVPPGVLVPEAGRDLEVPVEPGGHEQLLELLICPPERSRWCRRRSRCWANAGTTSCPSR